MQGRRRLGRIPRAFWRFIIGSVPFNVGMLSYQARERDEKSFLICKMIGRTKVMIKADKKKASMAAEGVFSTVIGDSAC